MALPTTYRFNGQTMDCHSPSVGASPVAAYMRIPFRCEIVSFTAITHTSHTTTDVVVTVALNGTTITSTDSTKYITLAVASAAPGLFASGEPQAKTYAKVDDYIAFTPASGGGAAVPCTFAALLRAI